LTYDAADCSLCLPRAGPSNHRAARQYYRHEQNSVSRSQDEPTPIHDWTRVDAGLFHAFHQDWIGVLARALNSGLLPRDYFAAACAIDPQPDPGCLDSEIGVWNGRAGWHIERAAVATTPPRARVVRRALDVVYVRTADRIAVRHRHGHVVAVIEIVSPGNKASKNELRAFVEMSSQLIMQGVHLLVIDLFPPSKRDPQGIHKVIWDEIVEEDFELPADEPLILAAYDAGPPPVAYVESIAVGDTLPEMAIFLKPDSYVLAPLEQTYQTTWDDFFPAPTKKLL
jgi:hypothetical protein